MKKKLGEKKCVVSYCRWKNKKEVIIIQLEKECGSSCFFILSINYNNRRSVQKKVMYEMS